MITTIETDKLVFHAIKDWDFPMRIQFLLEDTLQAEVIVPYSMAANVTARFFNNKAIKKLPFGESLEYRADLPRRFNIPVGSKII